MEEAEGDVDVVFGDAKDSIIEDTNVNSSAAQEKGERKRSIFLNFQGWILL